MDGLILDTERMFDVMVQEYAERMSGEKFPREKLMEVRSQMFGRKKEVSAQILHDALKLDDSVPPEDYLEWRKPREREMFPEAKLLPGAERLIRHLARCRVPLAIATSSTLEAYEMKISHHRDLFALFDKVVTGEQVERSKPSPEIFLVAAALIKVHPIEALVFEDAASGVLAGKGANMQVVAVPHHRLDKSKVAQADQVLESLEEFRPEDWGWPAFA